MTKTATRANRSPTQNGFAIRALRIAKGMSVQDLASAIDLSYSHLQNIEHENRSARREHLAKIAKALDVPVAALVRTPAGEDAA